MMGKKTDLFHGKQNTKEANSPQKSYDPKVKQKRVEFEKEASGVDSKRNDWVIDTEFGPVFIPQE